MPPRLVILESPYAGDTERNVRYARACLRDSLQREEAPLASHLLYTQPGVLDDTVPEQRAMGIEAGLAWGPSAAATVAYLDLGLSSGVQAGIYRAVLEFRPVLVRRLWPALEICFAPGTDPFNDPNVLGMAGYTIPAAEFDRLCPAAPVQEPTQ